MTRCRVNVHNDSPVTIDSHILSRKWHSSFRPLTSIAPVSHEIFFDELARWCRAKIPTRYGGDLGGFEIGPVFATGADLESALADSVIMVVLSVAAGI